MDDNLYSYQLQEYNKINNSFKEKLIFHVGISAGFHSEVDAMMQCMLFCYVNKIKFVLYADDANFSGGNGWSEFFLPFCEENHNILNKIANPRYKIKPYRYDKLLLSKVLKLIENTDFLTAEIFEKCIPRTYSANVKINWPLFDINGTSLQEFSKLRSIALHYNANTAKEVNELIESVKLPPLYTSIQFRGGDKILEVKKLMDIDETLEKIRNNGIKISHLFIFTDDYEYVEKMKMKCPNWSIYSLTKKEEHGYYNNKFNQLPWSIKRKHMIKLFAMIDICIASSLHLGCEQTCVNNYIKSVKNEKGYFPIMEEELR